MGLESGVFFLIYQHSCRRLWLHTLKNSSQTNGTRQQRRSEDYDGDDGEMLRIMLAMLMRRRMMMVMMKAIWIRMIIHCNDDGVFADVDQGDDDVDVMRK